MPGGAPCQLTFPALLLAPSPAAAARHPQGSDGTNATQRKESEETLRCCTALPWQVMLTKSDRIRTQSLQQLPLLSGGYKAPRSRGAAFTLQRAFLSTHADKKLEGVYTNARKQLLISSVPAVLILHLKRFHQVKGHSLLSCSAEQAVLKAHCAS